MSGFSSGVGLISGVNSAQLIDQLLALEARPRQQAQQRVVSLQSQRAAFLDINTALLSFKTAAQSFRTSNTFSASTASSSNADVLTATAGSNASAGSYQFLVKRLVSTQQVLSRAFTDSNSSAIGAGTFTFEVGGGSLSTETKLAELNGGSGVERGRIVVKDATGATATIDLSTAVTVGDVLEAINTTSGVSVRASVEGDRITITDTNASGSGALTVSNAAGYNTATSLGIAKTATAGFGQSVSGDRVRTLSGISSLASLNDGTGVNFRDAAAGVADLIITDRSGAVHNIELGQRTHVETNGPGTEDDETITDRTRASTIQDVIDAINTQSGGAVTASLNADKTGLVLSDTTGSTASNLIVRSATSDRTTARDLGIETSTTGVAVSSVSGRRLISGLNSVLVSGLNGGAGLAETALTITDRSGNDTSITLSAGALAGSVSDLISEINTQLQADSNGVRVALNRAGNGLALADSISGGAGNLSASGLAAEALGIDTSGATGGAYNGENLQSRWIARATSLSSLNSGKGIGTGTIRVTNAQGTVRTINVTDSLKTIDDFLQFFNNAVGSGVAAEINARGDGIVVRDTSGATGTLKIEDTSGTVAKNLNLVGSDDNDGGVTEIDGSFERSVAFAATDTLQQVASKINAAGVSVGAAVIRDGSGFRLSLTARASGSVGRTVIDTGALDLGLTTLARGDDAVAFYGSGDPARAVLLTSSSNTLDNVVQGITIDLKQTSDTPVSLVVSRDTAAVEKGVNDFVTAYNAIIDKLDRYDDYDTETQQSTLLFGDQTISQLRSGLRRIVQGTADGVQSQYTRLFQVGLRIGEESKLEFDREKFRSALEQDSAGVEALLAARDIVPTDSEEEIAPGVFVSSSNSQTQFSRLGILEKLGEFATGSTNSVNGTLTRRGQTIDAQIRSQEQRIDAITIRLEARRARLERQFADMEQAIASLQSQSSALGSLSIR